MPTVDFGKITSLFRFNEGAPLLFTSVFFLFLFFLFLLGDQYLKEKKGLRIGYITAFSFYFCYKASGFYFLILVAATLFNYVLARILADRSTVPIRRVYLVIGLVANFGILGYFKYTNFVIETINEIVSSPLNVQDIFLPVGISFYAFQVTAYLIDVYRGDIEPCRSLLSFSFFVSFFPKLLAGPIVRARELLPQIEKHVLPDTEKTGRGFAMIIAGLGKKLIIADFIAINVVGRVFDSPASYSAVENLMAVYGYTIQIYCDFSGYTDIALGIALLMGYELPPNFRSPYKAVNIADFWRRWHMSLSFWFRDYLYIPLGGNQCGFVRILFNIMATMVVCGLWHGASWTFVFWGVLHGAGLVVYRSYRRFFTARDNAVSRFFSSVFTFHFVAFGWIFFRADTFQTAFDMIGQITGVFDLALFKGFVAGYTPVFLCVLAGYMLHFLPDSASALWEKGIARLPAPCTAALLAAVIWLVVQFRSSGIQPFIYLQF